MSKEGSANKQRTEEEYREREHPTEDVNMIGDDHRERGESAENKVIPGAQRNQSDPNVK